MGTADAKPKRKGSVKKTSPKKENFVKRNAPTQRTTAFRKEKKKAINQRVKTEKKAARKKKVSQLEMRFDNMTVWQSVKTSLVILLSICCLIALICLLFPSERPASIWVKNTVYNLFGSTAVLFFLLLFIFCGRLALTLNKRFSVVPYGHFLYAFGFYMLIQMLIQQNANRRYPHPLPPDAAGYPMFYIIGFLQQIIGEIGVVILILILALFLLYKGWIFCLRKSEENREKKGIPVETYWKEVFTAEEAETQDREREKKKQQLLEKDIAEDFAAHTVIEKPERRMPEISGKMKNSFGKLRETLREISQPIEESPTLEKEKSRLTSKKLKEPEEDWLKDFPMDEGGASRHEAADVIEEISKPRVEPERKPAPKAEKKPERTETVRVKTRSVVIDENEESVRTVSRKDTVIRSAPKPAPSVTKSKIPLHWTLPDPEDVLDPIREQTVISADDPYIQNQARKIERLLDTFGAPSKVVEIQVGPTFTQFGVEPGFIERSGRKTRVRVKQIETLQKDLEMELSVKQLGFEAPIPGKTYVGLQVLNKTRIPVTLREIIEHDDYTKKKRELGIALGKDTYGDVFNADLTRMPHLLIAGATGMGKSVCLNAILSCLLLHKTPDELKLILIDPKRVELIGYNGIPHLITPVVVDIEQVNMVLQWVLREMDMRNLHFVEKGVRNIQDYNAKYPETALPYIVVVIDELASLMMEAAADVEASITRLAQTARAMGIHLIIATQRPSRDVVTGTIKGNLPTRIAFAMQSYVDSQVILNRPGAENLFGKGDMYFMSVEDTNLRRLQCVYVSDDEIRRIVNYWKRAQRIDSSGITSTPASSYQPETKHVVRISDQANGMLAQMPLFNEKTPPLKPEGDALYDEAVKMVQRNNRASANMLVSKLSIGYSRANKLLARMEEEGIIGPPNANPAIPREVLDLGEYGAVNED